MRALFKIVFHERNNPNSIAFTTENVIAEDAIQAIAIAVKDVESSYKGVALFVSDVELLGIETVER